MKQFVKSSVIAIVAIMAISVACGPGNSSVFGPYKGNMYVTINVEDTSIDVVNGSLLNPAIIVVRGNVIDEQTDLPVPNIKIDLWLGINDSSVSSYPIGGIRLRGEDEDIWITSMGATYVTSNFSGRIETEVEIPAGFDGKLQLLLTGPNNGAEVIFNVDFALGSSCTDGTDNDNDGLTDNQDSDCPTATSVEPDAVITACSDGIDNDGDTFVDMLDAGCSSSSDTTETGTGVCDNGLDDDGDTLVDMADPGCSSPSDTAETNAAIECDDGIDNGDTDALIDMADPGCSSPSDTDETSECEDGIDNDVDTFTDFAGADPECASADDNDESL